MEQKQRDELLNEIGRRCERCENTINLCVHHITYENYGNETAEDVMVLCKLCHDALHKRVGDFRKEESLRFVRERPDYVFYYIPRNRWEMRLGKLNEAMEGENAVK